MQTLNNNPVDNKNWFNQHATKQFTSNGRLGVRFIRDDIIVTVSKMNLLNSTFPSNREETFVKLVDISSKGISITTNVKLSINKKLYLTINFIGLKTFEIKGSVVRITKSKRPVYGIKFDKVNAHMAEYMLSSQKKLTFK